MHVIRLHGPWTAEISGPVPPETRRVHLPREWSELAELVRGSSVTLVRRFHRPTGLGEATRVSLAIPRAWPISAITINGESLATLQDEDELQRFDISQLVRTQEAHDLRISFGAGGDVLSAPYSVGIEITDPVS